jgi:hypothetical protein
MTYAGATSSLRGMGANMILGMSFTAFTALHVAISLLALVAGAIAVFEMLGGRDRPLVTGTFLTLTSLTSITGFLFPASQILPSHIVGVISLLALAFAITGYYGFRFSGWWRSTYVVAALTAFYLNTFVGVVQAFLKVGVLNALAPTGSELPFLIAQIIVLAVFLTLGVLAMKRFRPAPMAVSV